MLNGLITQKRRLKRLLDIVEDWGAPLPELFTPSAHQEISINFLLSNNYAGLFLPPGMGKTATTLSVLKILKEKGCLGKTLIIAPLRVCHLVWPLEISKWSNFDRLTYTILHGKDKETNLKKDVNIYLINHEGLDWFLNNGKNLKGFKTLVMDEVSKFKHTNTKRFKMFRSFLDLFERRYGLTGSPSANGLLDLFGQLYVIDKGASLGKYITHYKQQYFTQYNFKYILNNGSEEQIYKKIATTCLRLEAKDYLTLPDLTENNIIVELPKQAMKAYKELETELITKIIDNTVIASNAGVASSKCRQISNGFVYSSVQERETITVHSEKVKALSELVGELQGSPLLVAYEFKEDLKAIKKELGEDTPYIGAGVSMAKCLEIEKEWNKGNIPVLLGHPQSMAHGLNLQKAGYNVCFFSIPWNYELYDQFISRVYRQGNNNKKVFIHHIMARNTIDFLILQALKTKEKCQQSLFDALKKYNFEK